MSVTLTVDTLMANLAIDDIDDNRVLVTARLAYVTEAVEHYAPSAPDVVHNEAAIRLAGYLYDQPRAGSGTRYANGLRNSGAGSMLFRYRVHSAGLGNAVADANAVGVGTSGNPVIGVDIDSGVLVITFADGTEQRHALPAGGGGGGGSGATTAEITALIANHAAMPEIHHVAGGGGGGSLILGNLDNARLPGPAIAMRMGWGETNPPMADVFIRDGDSHHPQDGAAVGTSVLTYMPPFPPALAAEHTLFVFIWLEGSPTNVEIVVNPGLDNQGSFTSYFSDGDPLEVAGVGGNRLCVSLSL